MAVVLKPNESLVHLQTWQPRDSYQKSIFLGGTIDMGNSENWQAKTEELLSDLDITILNPRRDDWDSSWDQDPTPGTPFYEQVSWELAAQNIAEIGIYSFLPGSKSPITMLELGLFRKKALVICPKEFYRYGNIKMVCDHFHIDIVTFDEMIETIHEYAYF